jgi:hypothetical protein
MKGLLRGVVLVGGVAAALSGRAALADAILSGPDSNDGTYSTAALEAAANGTDTVTSGGVTGISLWGLLGGANASSSTAPVYGDITTSTPAGDNGKNAILRYYLLATSASGAQSVVSLGEIDPNFGGTAALAPFISYSTPTPDLIVPGASARTLDNVTSLQLLAVPAVTGPGSESTAVQLSGLVGAPGSYTLSDLQNDFTPVNETVSGDPYTGVPLWTFLGADDPNVNNQIVVTDGSDGYEVVLSLAELDPDAGYDGNPNDLLPYADTGGAFPGDGVARTILPSDNAHGRWESNLVLVDVEEVPEPGSISLMAAGLLSLSFMMWRRRA